MVCARVREPVECGQAGGGEVVGEEAQRAARFDGGQLVRVPNECDRGAAGGGELREPVQTEGAGHPGFVDEQDVARA